MAFLNSKTGVSKLFDPKTGFLIQNQGFLTPKTANYFQTFSNFFAKFLGVKKNRLFLKNLRTAKNKLFQNLLKIKVWKFPSNAGPYFARIRCQFHQHFT
jgi:hypothetical protein